MNYFKTVVPRRLFFSWVVRSRLAVHSVRIAHKFSFFLHKTTKMEQTASKILSTEERAAVISKARTYLDLEKERINQERAAAGLRVDREAKRLEAERDTMLGEWKRKHREELASISHDLDVLWT